MDAFTNLMRTLIGGGGEEEDQNAARRVSNDSGFDSRRSSQSTSSRSNLESDDESSNRNNSTDESNIQARTSASPSAPNEGGWGGAEVAAGLAALAIGAYGISKLFSNSSGNGSGRPRMGLDDDEEVIVRRVRRVKVDHSGRGTAAMLGLAGVSALGLKALTDYLDDEIPQNYFNSSRIEDTLKEIKKDADEFPVIGLDCQWNVSWGDQRNPVALLQICSHKGKVVLIRLSKGQRIPNDLVALLNNPRIVKSGIETIKDAQYLYSDYGINIRGTYDLRYLAEEMGHKPESLAKLAKKILNRDIGREWDLVVSDWEAETLTREQIVYAENAAHASVDIFSELIKYAITNVSKSNILTYVSDKLDKKYVYYSQNYK